jgi:hypothetical protein
LAPAEATCTKNRRRYSIELTEDSRAEHILESESKEQATKMIIVLIQNLNQVGAGHSAHVPDVDASRPCPHFTFVSMVACCPGHVHTLKVKSQVEECKPEILVIDEADVSQNWLRTCRFADLQCTREDGKGRFDGTVSPQYSAQPSFKPLASVKPSVKRWPPALRPYSCWVIPMVCYY